MKNILKKEIEKMENEIDENDIVLNNRSERNKQIIATYYQPKKKSIFSLKNWKYMLVPVAVVLILSIAIIPSFLMPTSYYRDLSYYKTKKNLTIEELSNATELKLAEKIENYTYNKANLYYDKDTNETLIVHIEYENSNENKSFYIDVARDKKIKSQILDYNLLKNADKNNGVYETESQIIWTYDNPNEYLGLIFLGGVSKDEATRIANKLIEK